MSLYNFSFFDKQIFLKLYPKGEYISDYIRENSGFYEIDHLEVLNFLPIRKNGVIIDVGANIGNHSLYYALILNMPVYAFEPIKENFDILKMNVFLNRLEKRVKVFNHGIDIKKGKKSYLQNVSGNSGTWSSTYNSTSKHSVTDTLDNIFIDIPISYIKIDVEGDELNVVIGGLRTIEKFKPVVSIEYHYGAQYKKIKNILSPLGYLPIYVCGRSNNMIFIHRDSLDISQLTALQSMLNSLKGRLTPPKTSLPSPIVASEKIEYELEDISTDIESLSYVVKNKTELMLNAYKYEKETRNKLTNDIDPIVIAMKIIEYLSIDSKSLIINLTDINFNDSTVLSYNSDGLVRFNDQSILSSNLINPYRMMIVRTLIIELSKKGIKASLLISKSDDIKYAHEFFEQHQVNYGLILNETPQLNWRYWTYFSNASFISSEDNNIIEEFKSKYIFPIFPLSEIAVSRQLLNSYQPKIVGNITVAKKKVLLVSYYALDLNAVGVLRSNYWFDNIPALSNDDIHIEMVTATRPIKEYENVHFVPDFGIDSASLVNVEELELHYKIYEKVNTVGLSWTKELIKYFDGFKASDYDVVILTGNPFMHFSFSYYAKARWNALVYQDYRDPLGYNPRFRGIYQADRQYYEDQFCAMADKVITVNDWCAKHMSKMSKDPVVVISNGYNDNVLEKIINKSTNNIEFKENSSRKKNIKSQHYLNLFKRNTISVTKELLVKLDTIHKSPASKVLKSNNLYQKITTDSNLKKAYSLIDKLDVSIKFSSPNAKTVRLVYAGSFAQDRNPTNLIKAVRSVLGYEFHHFGAESKHMRTKNSRVVSHGKVNYEEMVSCLRSLDVGVVYCSHDFVSTTKVYDYIACDMTVLIVTGVDNPYPQTLYEELSGLDNVYWVKDDFEEIRSFLVSFIYKKTSRSRRVEYSRKQSTLKLIDLITNGEV